MAIIVPQGSLINHYRRAYIGELVHFLGISHIESDTASGVRSADKFPRALYFVSSGIKIRQFMNTKVGMKFFGKFKVQ